MRRRQVLLLALTFILVGSVVRLRYESLGWGGYWYVDIVAPWQVIAELTAD